MKYYKSKTARFLAGKGFYPIVALCLIAVGVATWSAVSSLSGVPGDDTSSVQSYTANVSSYTVSEKTEEPAGNTVSDVTDSRVSSKQQNTDTSSAAPKKPAAEYFVMPIEGDIIKDFSLTSLKYSATYSDMRIHNGIDIKAASGSEIKAAGAGTVVSVEKDVLWGTVIEIDHGNNLTAVYCGIENPKVKENDTVHAGTTLGVLGLIPCESADEAHLHISFKADDEYLSPLEVMDMEG
ncbi:MAG: M23 family metallopeptidase [Clostridia bacterium]|nr:M23 family metallopeptidase [Clostridia bacterium]